MRFEEIAQLVEEQFDTAVLERQTFGTFQALVVKPDSIADVCAFLKNDERTQLKSLMCLGGADYPADSAAAVAAQKQRDEALKPPKAEAKEGAEGAEGAEAAEPAPEPEPTDAPRQDPLSNYPDGYMEVFYDLCSMPLKHRFHLKVRFDRNTPKAASVGDIWRGARWMERETWDLFGIEFEGHKDLRRLLTPPDWEGHPLRKDYVYPTEYHGWEVQRDYFIGKAGGDDDEEGD